MPSSELPSQTDIQSVLAWANATDFGDLMNQPVPDLCMSCEERSIRVAGPLVSWLESMAGRRIYCDDCARACEAGEWEGDPDD